MTQNLYYSVHFHAVLPAPVRPPPATVLPLVPALGVGPHAPRCAGLARAYRRRPTPAAGQPCRPPAGHRSAPPGTARTGGWGRAAGAAGAAERCLKAAGAARGGLLLGLGTRAPATHASGALWRVSGAAQPPAWGDHPDAPPAGCGGRGGDRHGIAALELGATAQARLCPGHGALPLVSRGDAAHHRRHHAGRGHPEDPPASEARGGPTSHCPSACPSRNLCVVLRLRCPLARPVGGEAWPSCGRPYAVTPRHGSVRHACTHVHPSLARARCPIVCTRLSRRPSSAPPALQAFLYQSLQRLNQSPPGSPNGASCLAPHTRPPPQARRPARAAQGWRRWRIGAAGGAPGGVGWATGWHTPAVENICV